MLEFIKEFWENDKGLNKKIMLYKKGDGFVLKTLIYNKNKRVCHREIVEIQKYGIMEW